MSLYCFPITFDDFDGVWTHSLTLVVTGHPNYLPLFAVANVTGWMEVDLVAVGIACCYDGAFAVVAAAFAGAAFAVGDFVRAVVQLHCSSFAASWPVKIPAPCWRARTMSFW